MKIAVVSIAKNEEQFVECWAASCVEADYRYILDTGSTDKTLHEIILNDTIQWSQQEFNPWRFDHARNAIWEHIPDNIDYVIWLDMDEVLAPGWRQAMETIPQGVTRPRYKYIWSWNPDGTEGLVYGGDKISARHGYYWKHPCHEVLKTDGDEIQHWVDGLEIHHHPDPSKSRSQYFPLLELAVAEDPNDDRNRFYLGREYLFHGMKDKAVEQFTAYLELGVWKPERAAACRYMADATGDKQHWLWRAVAEDCSRRENWYALAQMYYQSQNWEMLHYCTQIGMLSKEKPLDYLCHSEAWGWQFWDYAALAAHHMGFSDQAFEYGSQAVAMNPTDARLQNNLRWYKG